jgi:chromosome segregation ATPase
MCILIDGIKMGCGQSRETMITNMNSQITSLQASQKKLEEEKAVLEAEHAKLRHNFHVLEKEKDELSPQKHKLENEMKVLKEHIAKEKDVEEDPEEAQLKHELHAREEQIRALTKENHVLSTSLHKLKEQESAENTKFGALKDEIFTLENEIREHDERINELKTVETEYLAVKSDWENVARELASEEAKRGRLREEVAECQRLLALDRERRELGAEHNELTAQVAGLVGELAIRTELDRVVKENSTVLAGILENLANNTATEEEKQNYHGLIQRSAGLHSSLRRLKELEIMVRELTAEINELVKKKGKREERLGKYQGEVAEVTERINSLRTECEENDDDRVDYHELRKQVKDMKEKYEKKMKKIEKHKDAVEKKMRKHGGILG